MNEKYKKQDLRKTLEQRMREYWHDPKIKVEPMEFARMLRAYCERFHDDEEICRTRTLEKSVADDLGAWLGYPLC